MTKPPDIAGLMKECDDAVWAVVYCHIPRKRRIDRLNTSIRRLARAVEEATIERAARCARSQVVISDELADAIRALPRLTEEP